MYYIYHIPGIKIGCTTNPKSRIQKKQGYKKYEILETHNDIDIASTREIELQKQYGYQIDVTPYSQSYKWATSGNPSVKPMIAAAKKWIKNNKEKHSENCKLGGLKQGPIIAKKNVESGHISNLGKINANTIYTCPHCGKVGKSSGMFTWHFDRCRSKIVKY